MGVGIDVGIVIVAVYFELESLVATPGHPGATGFRICGDDVMLVCVDRVTMGGVGCAVAGFLTRPIITVASQRNEQQAGQG